MKIELLDSTHDRSSFDSGSSSLDKYLRETARQHIAKGISKTFVLVEEKAEVPKPILGFFTLVICEVAGEALPERWARRLPKNKIPALRLGRLAVSKAEQGKGHGKWLLLNAIDRVATVEQTIGGVGLFVDAKDEPAVAFYAHFGFERVTEDARTMFMRMDHLLQVAAAMRT